MNLPKRLYFSSKRAFDIFFSLTGLIITAPIILVISFLIWLENKGPAFFSQVRLGYQGRQFRVHKFRKFPAEWTDEGPGVTKAYDPRMTKVGTILERFKLDELPQLFNILKGEMSFVGPRPESMKFADLFVDGYERILEFVPGIFGPNQVVFRNENDLYPADEDPEVFYRRVLFPEKAANDLNYFPQATFFRDCLYIVKGFWVTLSGGLKINRFIKDHGKTVFIDILLIVLSWTLAYLTRYPALMDLPYSQCYQVGLVLLPPALILGFTIFNCYNHLPGFFYLTDFIRLVHVVSWIWLLIFLVLLGINRAFSLYLFPIFWGVVIIFLALPRIIARLSKEKQEKSKASSSPTVAIYGIGRGGRALMYWFNNGALKGIIDDVSGYKGKYINGYPILGHESDIPTIHDVHQFDELWMTFRPQQTQRKRIEKMCLDRNIKLVVLPELEPFSRFAKSLK